MSKTTESASEFARTEALASAMSIVADADAAFWALVDGNEELVVKRLSDIRKRAKRIQSVLHEAAG